MEIEEALKELENTNNIRFPRLLKIAETFFGKPRKKGSNHYPFKVFWQGEPQINFQEVEFGKPKPYQIKQLQAALIKLKNLQQENQNNGKS